jgi:hypothetical protein
LNDGYLGVTFGQFKGNAENVAAGFKLEHHAGNGAQYSRKVTDQAGACVGQIYLKVLQQDAFYLGCGFCS